MFLPEAIDLIVFDFDGVFTDNRVLVLQDGTEGVYCNRADGLGIEILRELKIPMLILSTEPNPVVLARAKKLGLPVKQGVKNKGNVLKSYCIRNRYDLKRVAYIGNDVNDLDVMRIVGYTLAPLDAHEEVKRLAKWIIDRRGGEGVIRRFAEMIKER